MCWSRFIFAFLSRWLLEPEVHQDSPTIPDSNDKLQLELANVKLIPCIISTGSMISVYRFKKRAEKGGENLTKYILCDTLGEPLDLDLGMQGLDNEYMEFL
jgi:hypothetical protein